MLLTSLTTTTKTAMFLLWLVSTVLLLDNNCLTTAFVIVPPQPLALTPPSVVLFSSSRKGNNHQEEYDVNAAAAPSVSGGGDNVYTNSVVTTPLNRRNAITTLATTTSTVGVITAAMWTNNNNIHLLGGVSPANAAEMKKVVVAGATGQTGRRVLERLAATASGGGLQVVGGVRDVAKATKALTTSSTVIRGAMIQNVASVDTSAVDLQHLDVVQDSIDQLSATLKGADALVIAIGFIPGNPLKMNAAAHEVDNVGTCRLIDAAKQAGTIKKIVMVSSILTNGRGWGQEKAPGFVVTNAFGNVLDEKLVAEQYLRASGIDYTIVRPGGLKAKAPSGALLISGEDTLIAGEISRDLVADVCIASLTDRKASNKVLEIIEDEGTAPKVFNGLNM